MQCSIHRAELPLTGRSDGVSIATLRIREGDPDARTHLTNAFAELFRVYEGPNVRFSVSVTANAILQAGSASRSRTYSVWYGQHFNRPGDNRNYNFANRTADGGPPTVSNLGDVRELSTLFSSNDFQRLFLANHSSSNVTVHSLISIVYLITRDLPNFQRDARGRGPGRITHLSF